MIGGRWLPGPVVGIGLCFLALTPAAAAVLTPVPSTVAAGNAVTVTLNDNIAPGSGVGAVDLTITFDHSLLTFASVTNGTLLAGWDAPTYNPLNGKISISEDLANDAEGTGSVVSLTFTALAADPTTVTTLTAKTYSNAVGVSGEYQLALTSTNIGITAAPVTPPTKVPEPGTIALLLAPMLFAAGLKRRDRC